LIGIIISPFLKLYFFFGKVQRTLAILENLKFNVKRHDQKQADIYQQISQLESVKRTRASKFTGHSRLIGIKIIGDQRDLFPDNNACHLISA